MDEEKKKLYEKQKEMLDIFLKNGAIDEKQYKKSVEGLKCKMGISDDENKKNDNLEN